MQAMISTLGELSLGLQVLVETFENGVTLDRREHRHKHHSPDAMATTADTALTVIDTAFAVHRCDANQCGNLFTVQLAEFR